MGYTPKSREQYQKGARIMGVWSKRVQTVVLGILLMAGWLTGCGPAQVESAREVEWSFSEIPCTVTLGEVEIQGVCSHSLEGVSAFYTQEPASLSGFTVQYRQGEYTVQMAGLTQKRSDGVIEKSVFGRLFSALDGAAAASLTWEGGQWSGELSTGEVVTVETREDGTLLTLAVPAWQWTARFSPPEK